MQKGDYVLATKYSDGDPGDQWAVGFFDRTELDRYYVTDESGKQFRGNGFRNVQKITKEEGDYLLKHKEEIESSDKSLWYHLKAAQEEIKYKETSRKLADETFYDIMKKVGVMDWHAKLAYLAVRLGGRFSWGK